MKIEVIQLALKPLERTNGTYLKNNKIHHRNVLSFIVSHGVSTFDLFERLLFDTIRYFRKIIINNLMKYYFTGDLVLSTLKISLHRERDHLVSQCFPPHNDEQHFLIFSLPFESRGA